MDRDDDVERLFSWIKTPDLHYREFAAEREVADAVATWPALRDAVPEPSPSDKHLEPEGSYEDELLPAERARHLDRPVAIFGHHETTPAAHHPVETPAPLREEAREVPWAEEPPQAAPTTVYHAPPPPPRPQAPPSFVRREPVPPVAPPPMPPPVPPQAQAPADQEYRGFEETPETLPPAAQPEHQGESRSLDAIFSRVAHQPRAPRDPRRQSPGAPGLGPVFRRLR